MDTTEWNGFGFKPITLSDYPAVLTHLKENFYLDEPIQKALGVTEERASDIDRKCTDILNLNSGSFFAYPLDQPEKVASVLILWLHEKGKHLPPFEPRSPQTILVRKALVQLESLYDIFEKRGVDAFPELFIISSDRQYRGKGLATEMYRRAIGKLKSEGFTLAASTFTNPFSRAIGEKLGFKEVARLNFDDCKNEDGSCVFGEAGNGEFVVETILDL